MSESLSRAAPGRRPKRPGAFARLLVGLLGLAVAGFGAACCFLCPGLVGFLAAGLFGPFGAFVLFIALRGRQSDIQEIAREFTPTEVGGAMVGEAIAKIAEGVIDNV